MISVQYLGFKWSSVSHIHVPRGIVTTPVDEGFIDGMYVLQREREREREPASISRPEREKWIIFKSPISVRPEPVALTTDAG